MDIGTALSVTQTLFAALECPQLRDVFSILGYKDQLDGLAKTVETVKAVLLDAESKGDELTHQAQLFVNDLKFALLEADDLLDEFVTLAERKHHKFTNKGALAKARALFSCFKELPTAQNMSKQVKNIKKKLDAIADNHNKFGFKLDSQPIRQRKEETCSYVYTKDIIGRDAEKEKIVNRLLETNAEPDVSFLTIVGIGALGKITLAQLVFNDDNIQKEFPKRCWACVGDEDTQHLNVKTVLANILEQKQDSFSLRLLQGKFKSELTNKKYLLIIDDVWIEKREEWLKLEVFFMGGALGSWVLVTTRSSTTTTIIGDGSLYDLKGLLDEQSWRIFEMVAFGQVGGESNPPDLVEIGQKVVEKCSNVPLAIRVAGSLLYGQPRSKCKSFERSGFVDLDSQKNGIMPILKYGYYNLDSPLKCCFSYCALFPKDYVIEKERLMRLWEAQGYIVACGGETKEDVAEEYFSILLRRRFFQDVIKDKDGEIWGFKIHDMLHDVAQQVGGKEIGRVNHLRGELDNRIVHLRVDKSMNIKGNSSMKTVRTLFFDPTGGYAKLEVGAGLGNCRSLRALVVRDAELEKIAEEIGKLIHLRLVDFSRNIRLKKLPKSITKLHNLETLLLRECRELRELPNDIDKLVKLRCLDLSHCHSLVEIPESIGKLTSLCWVPWYVVKKRKTLEGLRGLNQLKSLHLRIGDLCSNNEKVEIGEGQLLINKQHLNDICLRFVKEYGKSPTVGGKVSDYEEALLERLQPHINLKSLEICGYIGGGLPSWASGYKLGSSLSNLVSLEVVDCYNLKYLPGLEKLQHLRMLELSHLESLEYMEEKSRNTSELEQDYLFFPSLQKLMLAYLPKLKGWWREEGDEEDPHRRPLPSFSHLFKLIIMNCNELTSIPDFLSVKYLRLYEVNEKLRISLEGVNEGDGKALG